MRFPKKGETCKMVWKIEAFYKSKDNPKLDPAGCLVLVFNYTGDRLNFGLATEQARREGRKVGNWGSIWGEFSLGFGLCDHFLWVHATGRRSWWILAWGNFQKNVNSHFLGIHFQSRNCFSWCAGPGDKLHWGPDPLWSCHWARQEGRHQGGQTFSSNFFELFLFSTFPSFSTFPFPFPFVFLYSYLLFEWLHTFLCNPTRSLNFVSWWSFSLFSVFLSSDPKTKHCPYF